MRLPWTQPLDTLTRHATGGRAPIDAILADRPALSSFYDGLRTQEVIEAALLSDRAGRRVTLDQ
jgi:predicted dehydrogenase